MDGNAKKICTGMHMGCTRHLVYLAAAISAFPPRKPKEHVDHCAVLWETQNIRSKAQEFVTGFG